VTQTVDNWSVSGFVSFTLVVLVFFSAFTLFASPVRIRVDDEAVVMAFVARGERRVDLASINAVRRWPFGAFYVYVARSSAVWLPAPVVRSRVLARELTSRGVLVTWWA
jgi:hypothetical protein